MLQGFLEAAGRLDFAAFQWLRAHHSPILDVIMAGFSDIARGGVIWVALAVLIAFVYRPRWPGVVHVVLAVLLAFAITDYVAKPLFNEYLLAFELTSVLLLVAILGAVVVGRRRV